MSIARKIFSVVLLLIFVFLILFIFDYFSNKRSAERLAVNDKMVELSNLITTKHDCATVIEKAQAFLKENNDPEIWQFLGACQFDTGDFKAAQASFENILKLDSSNKVAKSYLDKMTSRPGEIQVVGLGSSITQVQFEKDLGVKLFGLVFKTAVKKPSTIPKYEEASYTSVSSLADTVSKVKDTLNAQGLKFSGSELPEGTVLIVSNTVEQKIFSILKGSSVTVKVQYLKLQ